MDNDGTILVLTLNTSIALIQNMRKGDFAKSKVKGKRVLELGSGKDWEWSSEIIITKVNTQISTQINVTRKLDLLLHPIPPH